MFSNKMIAKKKILLLSVIIAVFVVSVAAFQSNISFAATTKTQPLKVVGMAKFVVQGTVQSTTANSITLHITNTSKNAKLFDNKDKAVSVGSKTAITKNGKNIKVSQVKYGDKVKVFGVFDKKSGSITLVRWIKVLSK